MNYTKRSPTKDKPGIIKALIAGEKWEWIEKEFNVSQMTIYNYKKEAGIEDRYKRRK